MDLVANGSPLDHVRARAAALGVVDILVFRRVAATTWAHLGGVGRGHGWAGVIDVDEADEPLLRTVPRHEGAVVVAQSDVVERVVGPYYARGAASVRIDHDVVVVLANPTAPLAPTATESELRTLALEADLALELATPSKRLADELEVLHAVRAVMTTHAQDLHEMLDHIVRVVTESLSCEVGAIRDGAGHVAVVGDLDPDGIRGCLDELTRRAAGGTWCVQDTSTVDGLGCFAHDRGALSVLVLPVPEPLGGVVVAAHTTAAPRGFTSLCRRLGEQVVDAASVVAHTAALREELRSVAEAQSRVARTDALTGLGNRLAWDEALAAAQDRVDEGGSATVITLDLDGLKELNDTYGHDAGDDLLRRCAAILRAHCRDGDVVVRLGGDEFALLLPLDDDLAASRVAALSEAVGAPTSCASRVAASVGAGTATSGRRVADAVRDADAAMYAQKRRRRLGAAAHRRAAG